MTKGHLVAVIVLVVVLVGGGVFYTMQERTPSDPEEAIERMVSNMNDVHSFAAEMNMDMELRDEREEFDISLFMDMKTSTKRDKESFEGDIDIDAFVEGEQFDMGLAAKVVDEKAYFKVTSLPQIVVDDIGPMARGFENIWIGIDISEMEEEMDDVDIDEEKLREAVMSVFDDKDLYTATEVDESSDWVEYSVSFDEDVLIETLKDLVSVLAEIPETGIRSGDIDFDELRVVFDMMEEDLEVNLKIGKRDGYLYGVSFENSLHEPGGDGVMHFSFDISMSDFNEDFEIEAPEEYQDLMEMFGPMMMPQDPMTPGEVDEDMMEQMF